MRSEKKGSPRNKEESPKIRVGFRIVGQNFCGATNITQVKETPTLSLRYKTPTIHFVREGKVGSR